jgi:hypothetical protein
METANVTQQMITFQKQSFDNFQRIWEATQTQTDETIDRWMDQALWSPPECRQAIENWRQAMETMRNHVNAYVAQSFDICEKMFRIGQPSVAPKPQLPQDKK